MGTHGRLQILHYLRNWKLTEGYLCALGVLVIGLRATGHG